MTKCLNTEELLRYQRHLSLPEVGMVGQLKLKQAKVLCVGAGGLGSPVLTYLAAAGVGTIGIIDPDRVEVSNLQRQILYSMDDLGAPKVIAAKQRLEKLNSTVEFNIYDHALTHDNALAILQHYDVIVDGSDNFATRYLVNDACFHLKKPHVHASIFKFQGQCSIFTTTNGPCYRCLYPEPPPAHLVPNCAEAGVLGVLPGILGGIQASEVIKLILGIGEPLIGKLLTFDALSLEFKKVTLHVDPHCLLCQLNTPFAAFSHTQELLCDTQLEISVPELKNYLDKKISFTLIDVREPYEYEICNINGRLIPLAQLEQQLALLNPNQKYVVHCRSGKRSMQAVQRMREKGFNDAYSLKGGIMEWMAVIDSAPEL